MTFKEQFLATFIGAGIAFLFAMILFYFKEGHKAKKEKITMYENLRKEILYNSQTLERILSYIKKRWERIGKYHDMDQQEKQNVNFDDYMKKPILDENFKISTKIIETFFKQGNIFDIIEPDELYQIEFLIEYPKIKNADLNKWEKEYFNNNRLPTIMDSQRVIELKSLEERIKELTEISVEIEKKGLRIEDQGILKTFFF